MTALFSDHSDLEEMVEVVSLNSARQDAMRFGLMRAFWATPERPSSDTTYEVLELTFTGSLRVNWMQFDLVKFPHTMWAQYYDESSSSWLPIIEVGGSAVSRTVHETVPSVLPPPRSVNGHLHPQHSFLGHWQTERISLVPVVATRIRLALVRQRSGVSPVDVYGNQADYSLAVRDFSIGYQIASADDVPRTLPADDPDQSYSQSFASAEDTVGSTMNFSLRALDASRVIRDNAEDAFWRCEPQPDPTCVVSLYADGRTADGRAQVVDRIFLDPINTGAHVSVYYAGAAPTGNFVSPATPLRDIVPDATPNVTVDSTGLHFSLGGTYPASESLILDNSGFSYDPSLPWWVGLVMTPSFNQPVPPDIPVDPPAPSVLNNVVFDCGRWSLAWTDTGLLLQVDTGDQIDLAIPFSGGDPTTVLVGFDGTDYTLWASNAWGTESSSAPATTSLASGSVVSMALGSDLARTAFGQSDISAFVIKEETPPSDGLAYKADPGAYSRVLEYHRDEPDTSRLNAILRFDPSSVLASNTYPWHVYGGTPSKYESMTWTPVPRDYTCQRGWLKLPPIRACYWKFEFTHLQPTYADIYQPVAQIVRHFPVSVVADFRQRFNAASAPVDTGDDAQQRMSGYTNYSDTPSIVGTGGTGTGYTSTEVYVADDLQAADRLAAAYGENWDYQRFMSPLRAPRFNTSQVHVYRTETVTRLSKVAYQVGVRNLKLGRTIHASSYDTPQYEDEFFDTANLNSTLTSWVLDEDRVALTSGLSTGAQIVSQTMQSNRGVRGVQFAAQQSPPGQVLLDANFDDPRHLNWSALGDARLDDGVNSPAFGQIVPVIRTLTMGYWEDIAPRYGGTWGGIEAAGATWGQMQGGGGTSSLSSDSNGIASVPTDLPDGGYVYAAARVIVYHDLYAPLWLQVVDSVTGAVLAESSATARKGQLTEWFTTYELGSASVDVGVTWGDLEGHRHWPSLLDAFTRADGVGLGRLDSGQYWAAGEKWNGTSAVGLDIVSNAAQATVAGARSTVDLGTPWGSLSVKIGAAVGGTPVELIDLGNLLLMSDGKIMGPNTGRVYTTLTVAANDLFRFDFMPTSQVPVGQSSGADAGILSWSVSIFRNNVFATTVSTAAPFATVRGLAGQTGQRFTSFTWAPSDITVPVETVVCSLPVPRDGALDSGGQTWTQQSDGRVWGVEGAFTPVDNGVVQSLAAPAGQSFVFSTDTDDLYGAMTFKFTPSTTTTDATSYYAVKLDDGQASQLYLRADGALVQSTPDLGVVVLRAAAVPSWSGTTTVLFARTVLLSAAFTATYSLSASLPQTLVFLNDSTVVGTYQGTDLFVNTTRSVMGTDGSVIAGFTWAPDLGPISSGAGVRTWDDVSGRGTRTWGEVSRSITVLRNPIVARVVQKGPSQDVWYMDALAIYLDPIVWSFSNDAGATWTDASTIRNNPDAVVMFPAIGAKANKLVYRVTSYAADTWLAHLVIRPWYLGFSRDMPMLPSTHQGPNLNPLDSYVPVHQDPNFMVWSTPVPREFFYAFRSILPGSVPDRIREPFVTERSVV